MKLGIVIAKRNRFFFVVESWLYSRIILFCTMFSSELSISFRVLSWDFYYEYRTYFCKSSKKVCRVVIFIAVELF